MNNIWAQKQESTVSKVFHFESGMTLYLGTKVPREIDEGTEALLIVDVGAIDEEQSESGMAHFIEHLAFGSTRNYPSSSLVDSLERWGLKLGLDYNAHTFFDKTVYKMHFSNDLKNFESLFVNITHQWLSNVLFQPEIIENEKRVIHQEERMYRQEIDPFYKFETQNSLFQKRPILGTDSSRSAFDVVQLTKFYSKHYKPNNAALIFYGNVNEDRLLKLCEKYFGRLVSPTVLSYRGKQQTLDTVFRGYISKIKAGQRQVITYALPVFFTKDSMQLPKDFMYYKYLAYFLKLRLGLLLKNQSVVELSSLDFRTLAGRNYEILFEFKVQKNTTDTKLNSLLKVLLNEIHSLRLGMFDAQDVEETLDYFLRMRSQQITHRDFVEEAEQHFLMPKTALLTDIELENWSKSFDVDYFKTEIMAKLPLGFLGLQVYRPENFQFFRSQFPIQQKIHGKVKPRRVKSIIPKEKKPHAKDIYAFKKQNITLPNVENKQYILKKIPFKAAKSYYYHLVNGMDVLWIMKPNADSSVKVNAVGRGGFNTLTLQQYPYLQNTISYLDLGGISGRSNTALKRYFNQYDLFLNATIGDFYHEIYGEFKLQNLSRFIKILPRFIQNRTVSNKVFRKTIREEKKSFDKFKHQRVDTTSIFYDMTLTLDKVLPPTYKEIDTKEEFDKIKLSEITQFYKQLFAGHRPFTWVIQGEIPQDVFECLFLSQVAAIGDKDLEFAPNISPKEYLGSFVVKEKIKTKNVELQYVFPVSIKSYKSADLVAMVFTEYLRFMIAKRLRMQHGVIYTPVVIYNRLDDRSSYISVKIQTDIGLRSVADSLVRKELTSLLKLEIDKGILESVKHRIYSDNRWEITESPIDFFRKYLIYGDSIEEIMRKEKDMKDVSDKDLRCLGQKIMSEMKCYERWY